MEVLKLESNVIKWSGFFDNSAQGQAHLKEKIAKLSQTKRIISVKKVLVNRKLHGLFLFRFTVIVAPKDEDL